MVIMMPASYLEPGVVETSQWPFIGVADIGCYPEGRDLFANILADELGSAGVFSMAREDIMAWKYAKMLMNVGNAVDAICGSDPNVGEVMQLVRAEAEECYRAAGIVYKHGDEYGNRSSSFRLANQALNPSKSQQPAVPQRTSSWQSLMRGTGSSESDFFNGEIALLGRLHGFSTPANEVLQDLSDRQARQKAKPGSMTADDVLRLIAERRTRSVRA
jgi:2-dehydropantoate 2-reductase